jgi:hypothetical protein
MHVKGKSEVIAEHLQRFLSLTSHDRELLEVGVALESGRLPLIHQYGYAEFRPESNDHRLLTIPQGVEQDETPHASVSGTATAEQPREGPPVVGSGPAAVRTPTQGAEAGASAREQLRRTAKLVDVIDEDSRDLPLYFPQFTSQVLYDDRLAMWYREGWIQPFGWHPARFLIRFYYPGEAMALPIIVADPIKVPSPHLWRTASNGKEFLSLCYTFAPDRTVDRSRDSDVATEILRQVVLWLVKHLVWCRFGFWAGPEVGHGASDIEQSTRPDDPCPTHTWMRYSDCCRPRHIAELRHRHALRFGVNPEREIRPSA